MRLTLRTLLAYMDGILEPEQAEALRKKVEESEFAAKLMDRIREVSRRLRLGAPHVREKAELLDPNTVAEYLDNTLHGDRVPDFEKVCLESDMHLAEVASCHQILTMILGEAAEIDPQTRQRMYQLLEQVAAAEQAEENSASPGSGTDAAESSPEKPVAGESGPTPAKPKASVPEYLREPTTPRRFWVGAALLFLAGFAAMILLGALGMLDPGKPLARLLGISGPEEVQPAASQPTPPEPSPQETPAPSGKEKLTQPEGVLPKAPSEAEKPGTEKAPLPEEVQKTPPSEPGKEKPSAPSEKPEEKPKAEAPPPSPPAPEEKPPEEKPGEKMPPAEPAKPAPQLLGRLVSDREVLLRLDPVQQDWWPAASQGNISSGERLLALPTFRPVMGLSSGITITLIGAAEVELLPGSVETPPGMKVLFGRAILSTVGKENVPLRIQVEGGIGLLTLLDPDSTAAIAVSRMHIPGNDPLHQPDPVKVEIYTIRGRSAWTGPEGKPLGIPPQQLLPIELSWIGGGPAQGSPWKMAVGVPVPIAALPEWITKDTSNPLERRASPEVEQKLRDDQRMARIGLMELLDHRLPEVQALAIRCLSYLGEYQRSTALLNKPEERSGWFDAIELLQEATLRSPESAVAVQEALAKQYGSQNATLLYRMLLGYSEEGLKAGEAAALVDLLDHNDLVFRVLSFWNLQKLTGKGFYYQPEAPKTKRDPAVKRWRDWLAQWTAGKISLSKEAAGAKEAASKPSGAGGPAPTEPPKPAPPAPPPETPPATPSPLPKLSTPEKSQ